MEEKSLKIKPDGHCFINSILASLQSHNIYLDSSLFKQKCIDEFEMDTRVGYSSMLRANSSITNKQTLLNGIACYFDKKEWNNDVGDILVLIFANAFKLKLEIMTPINEKKFF